MGAQMMLAYFQIPHFKKYLITTLLRYRSHAQHILVTKICHLPYVLFRNEIFPLRPWLMKSYPGKRLNESQRIFLCRLSRPRRTVENAFGILSAMWRIFRKPIRTNVDLAEKIMKATVCLHNYLRVTENANYIP